MKAKEYFQKHYANLPDPVSFNVLIKVTQVCFVEFYDELRTATNPLQQQTSKVAKIKEFHKKWIAIADLVEKKYSNIPENYRRIVQQQELDIDRHDLTVVKMLLESFIQERYPTIHAQLVTVSVARDRLKLDHRPKFHPGLQYRNPLDLFRAIFGTANL